MTLPRTPFDADGEQDEPALCPLVREATVWVIRLTGGETTLVEMEEFRRWRDATPEHAAALAEARRHWLLLGYLAGPEPASPSQEGSASLESADIPSLIRAAACRSPG